MSKTLFVVLPIAGLLALVTLVAAAPGQVSQATLEPLDYFKKMLPVLMHPRCVNCHGGVDPVSGLNHKGGPQTDPYSCEDCHTDTGMLKYKNHSGQPDSSQLWHLPNPSMFWDGKDAKQVCAQLADFVMLTGRASFIHHLDRDSLVILGFLGMAGGAGGPAAPPPLTKKQFIDTATVWLHDGMAACVRDGEIQQTEEVVSDATDHPKANVSTRYQQSGKRTAIVTLAGGQYRMQIKADGERLSTTTINSTNRQGGPCTIVMLVSETYSTATRGPAIVRSTVKANGDYTVTVTGPYEKTRVIQTYHNTSDCGPVSPAAPTDDSYLDWKPWSFTIVGNLRNPTDKQLVGGCDKTIKSRNPPPFTIGDCFRDEAFQVPWLMDHGAAASEFDGTDIPFRVNTLWNFRYK